MKKLIVGLDRFLSSWSRVTLQAVVFALLLMPAVSALAAPNLKAFSEKIAALELKGGGRLGVAVVGINGKQLLAYRADERFAMCSTFKTLLGAAILARVDAGQESLARKIAYTKSDLLEYAPITRGKLGAGSMTIAELNAASIEHSDNTAANLLLNTVGGPKGLTAYLRSIGDTVSRLDRTEPTLNTNIPNDLRDTSTPQAMATTLRKLLMEDHLSPASKEQLKRWLFSSVTGTTKLRAGLDKDWIVGDKTGSGENGASNDVAIVYPRGLPPFVIAVYYTGSKASSAQKSAVIAEIARTVASTL